MAGGNAPHRYVFGDLREWLAAAEQLGEVKHLKGLSWEREIGMVSALVQRADPAPCVVFEDIPGVPAGFRRKRWPMTQTWTAPT